MEIVNERIKPFLKDPTLYRTKVTVGEWGVGDSVSTHYAFSYSDGDDIQTAEDISLNFLISKYGIDEDRISEVSTDTYEGAWT